MTDSASHQADLAAEYEALLDFMYQAPVGLVQMGADGAVEMLNPMAARLLLPVSRNGRLSNLFDALENAAPELRSLVARFPAPSGTVCHDHRITFAAADARVGEPTVLSISLMRLFPARLMAVIQDVSVAAANERRLRESETFANRIIDTAPDTIIVVDADGKMVRVNRRAEESFGYAGEEMVGQPVEMLMPERFHIGHVASRGTYMQAPVDRAMIRDGAPARVAAGRRKDGSEFAIEAGLGALVVNARPHVVATVRDVTDRLEAQSALTSMNRELEERVDRRTEQLSRSLEEMASFSYAVAHDLRTPLRTIVGFASLMREDGAADAAERDDMLGKISDAAQRMAQQIDGLLELAQLSRVELKLHLVDLSELARNVVAELRRVEPARVVDVQIEDGMHCLADPALMRSVLENLIGNAWKYTSRTPAACVRVGRSGRHGTPGFSVSDNGAGFDMRYADKLFEVFQRMHRQEDFAGVGIGLATVRRIIERHGGAIHADASPGKGATFWFSLPD